MSAAAGAATAGLCAGAALLVSAWRQHRPDPIARALHGHPAAPVGSRNRIDRMIDRIAVLIAPVGPGRDVVLGLTAARLRARRLRVLTIVLVAGTGLLLARGPAAALWVVVAGPVTLLVSERLLDRKAVRYREIMGDQTLLVSQFVALCLTAGLTTAEALDRASAQVGAPLGPHLRGVSTAVRAGRPLEPELTAVTRDLAVPELDRLTDTLITGARHGVPLAAVLRHQVEDARNRRRTAALERAGKAEIAMLVPVVFLILPAVVVVAVYPGFVALTAL